jgi:hypothetical protein
MNKLVAIFIFCFVNYNGFSQDTIVLKSLDRLFVRVLEISSTEVRYKNFFNPDGVIRVLNYNEIESITYENGKKESRFLMTNKNQKSAVPFFIIENKHISLRNKDLTHKEAFNLMLKKDPQTNSEELNGYLINAESKKNGQIGFTILSPVCILGGFYIAKRNYYGPKDLPKFKTILFTGFSLGVCSFIAAQVYKSVKNKNIRKAAEAYNNDLLSN